ncbi:hypothetical protein FB567DRAFT_575248 [Paraphoma chrysanthemicola]|uniref:UBA domain-containing protein n=1 Tax=Paraphoma chrysanthemicola TaxID=798071 RepID=A0A8K0W524_9PLEO|nr:hypothetical protein FB567DRAFT_575248 [Paraphoma chrysanthemicola]
MRVIQDSDDEFEEEVEAAAPPPAGIGASASTHAMHTQDISSASGTGSTESLKRAFAEAHKNHLQNPSVPSGAVAQGEIQSSMSLPEYENKKRKASTDVTARASQNLLSPRQGPVTYAKRSKSVLSSHFAGSANEDFEDFLDQTNRQATVRMPWDLDYSIRDDLAQHEPNVLFPEPSSTIPNATLTQQRVLEGVTGPTLLGTDETLAPINPAPEPSVPWSDIMKFTPGDTAENPEPYDQQGRDDDSLDLVGLEKLEEACPLPSSSQDLGLPSALSKRSHSAAPQQPLAAAQAEENRIATDLNSEDDLVEIDLPKEQYKPRPSRSRSLKTDTQDSIDYSVRPEVAAKSAKRRKTTTAVATTRSSGMADVATTPQKVQQICEMGFTPTSTESALRKNNKNVAQTVGWLVNHGLGEDELALHNTPKRRPKSKTLIQISDGGTVDSLTKRRTMQQDALKVADSGPSGTVHIATSPSDPHIVPGITTAGAEPVTPRAVAQTENQQVQVVIPAKSPNAPSPLKQNVPKASNNKPKRRKTTLDMPEADTPIKTATMSEMTTTKRKGRGRPKKDTSVLTVEATTGLAPTTVGEHTEPSHPIVQKVEISSAMKNFASVDTAITPCKQGNVKDTLGENAPGHPSRPATESDKPANAVLARTPDQTVKKSSRSPTSRGKVSYRVGLSKRARIAPLLRVVKK